MALRSTHSLTEMGYLLGGKADKLTTFTCLSHLEIYEPVQDWMGTENKNLHHAQPNTTLQSVKKQGNEFPNYWISRKRHIIEEPKNLLKYSE